MTSPQTNTPASNSNTAASAPSYASAAGAKTSTPVVATGSNPPIVATGSSATAPRHAKSSSISPLNGRPNIMPAIPNVPPVAHGTLNANGVADHSRKSSVTMSANGPNSYSTNGGTAGGKANIQFGYQSPAVSTSSPKPGSAPIPIPDSNPRVTSPQASPSPIPQPSASGGRPPSGTAQQGMTFGSFGGESERPHMRTTSVSQDPSSLTSQHSPHMRRGSNVSDMSNQAGPPHMGRGNFQGAGRGRGFSNNSYNQPMGYPPNHYNRAPQNPGRGGMPPAFGNPRQQPYGTPPPHNRSPALPPAMPHPPNMAPAGLPQYYYPPPPMGPQQVPQQGYYPQQFDPNMRPMIHAPGYPVYPIMNQGQSPVPAYQQPYNTGPYNPPGAQPMSRNSSQVSTEHRPASSTGQTQAPPGAQGTPQPQPAQIKPAVVASPQFNRPPKKNMAIKIKNAMGETVDVSSLKVPASPAPSSQHSKTPPVIATTPTPPPKSSTPKISTPVQHSRADSVSNSKTAEEVRNEFKEKMKQAASADKAKEEEAAKAAAAEKAKEEERLKAEQKAQEEAKAAEEAKARQEAEEKEKAEREAAKAVPKKEEKKEEPPKVSDEPDEDELERIIREMEEEDARREKEEEERRVKYEAEKAAKKKAEEANRLASAAENDRKLREAEAEMERLEDEKERKRALEGSKAPSVQELMKQPTDKPADKADASSTSETTSKLPSQPLTDKPSIGAGGKPTQGGRGPKPAALNLAPLKTNSVEPPQPSAALQSLKTARLLGSSSIKADLYPPGIQSPNPALNAAVARKGTSFKYDSAFLLQFQKVFTEQPSLDFHQQVKTLIGDGESGRSASARTPAGLSNRQNSRTGAPGIAGFGSFAAPIGRTLPPGTTSAQRFEMSGDGKGRPSINPMASFQRPGGVFPGGSQMARTPSTSNMSMPHSPRQGSRRNASKQNTFNAKHEAQAAKTMPLTQGMKIEALNVSSTGWKPSSIGKGTANSQPGATTLLDPSMVQRKVKAALNKMAPEKFDRISDQILQIAAQSKDETDGRTLRQVIQLTFEKATDEAHWASMYAKFCKRMLEMMSPEIRDENIKDKNGQVVSGGALFRKYLLNRCQEEFERGWKMALPDAPEEGNDKKTQEAVMLSEEYYAAAAAKRRGLGLVQFIGELYKLGMLTERIMHECVRKLVDYSGVPDEAEIESLSKLLRTIGGNLDSTDKGRVMMDAYFVRIQGMVDLPELPSRLKFMLMDVVDLRKANWISKETNKGPKTLEEIRAEAEAAAAQKAAEAARTNQRGGGGPGRPQIGRGDARNFSGYTQQAQNQVGMDDLRRLKGGANRTSTANVTLGPMSMLNSRSNSGRRLGPGGSLSRGAEDSGASSRTGTPPVRETQSINSFSLLANMDSENPASPPSTAASPALAKVAPDTTAASEKGGN